MRPLDPDSCRVEYRKAMERSPLADTALLGCMQRRVMDAPSAHDTDACLSTRIDYDLRASSPSTDSSAQRSGSPSAATMRVRARSRAAMTAALSRSVIEIAGST